MVNKRKKTIKSRWIKTILAVTIAVLLILAATILFSVYTRYITTAELTIRARISSTVDNYFSNYSTDEEKYASEGAGNFVENFAYSDIMEVQVLDRNGNTLATSNVFGASTTVTFQDYTDAIADESGTGVCITKTSKGESVLALTYMLKNESGEQYGALRYLVSLESALDQFKQIAIIIVLLFALIIILIAVLGRYFVSSIVQPVEKINSITKIIAKGDFNVRIENNSDDEIGELSDSINEMADKLNEIDKMKNEFISTVSHEIRTPLTAIKGWGETLKSITDNQELTDKGLDIIISETSRLTSMVEELLDFSRMQNGSIEINTLVFDLKNVVTEIFENYSHRAETENKTLIFDSDSNEFIYIRGDESRVRQVFINIIDNALKYTDEGSVIKIGLERNQKYVTIYFSDNGKGISERDLPYIKEKFYKADNTVRGTGIGLAVADEIIKKHNGKLNIKSKLGVGTRVEITLPVYISEE